MFESDTSSEVYKSIVEGVKQAQEQFARILYYKPKD